MYLKFLIQKTQFQPHRKHCVSSTNWNTYDCLGIRLEFIVKFVQNMYVITVAQNAEGLNLTAGVAHKYQLCFTSPDIHS
jgi:hypothetical protein